MKSLAGVAVVIAHAIAFVVLASRCHGTGLEVDVATGAVPPAIAERVTTETDGDGAGLRRTRWSIAYRGGFERSVGATQLVGPFQDPAARTCVGRVVVTQKLLDEVGREMRTQLELELRGEEAFPLGRFRRISALSLRWTRLEWHADDRAFVREAPHGYVRAALTVQFDRVDVPLVIALVPQPATTELTFKIISRAKLDFGNRVAQWISDKLGGNRLATRLARRQIDGVLLDTLAPPPPFELPGGQTLRFGFCGDPPEIIEGTFGALPFSLELGQLAADPSIRPPRRGPGPKLPPSADAALAIDLDLDALNGLLFELWRGGFLDDQLAAAGLDRRFNTDPIVTELLSIRISPIRLALPPVLAPAPNGLRLSADARATIADGVTLTTGRIWGGLDLQFGTTVADVGVDLGALELSCERTPTRLVPCYADLVAAVRDRGSEFHGALTTTFTSILSSIFVDRRLGGSGLPADLLIRSAVPRLTVSGNNASLHLDLDATLVGAQ